MKRSQQFSTFYPPALVFGVATWIITKNSAVGALVASGTILFLQALLAIKQSTK